VWLQLCGIESGLADWGLKGLQETKRDESEFSASFKARIMIMFEESSQNFQLFVDSKGTVKDWSGGEGNIVSSQLECKIIEKFNSVTVMKLCFLVYIED
jgi:hypothetical protein